MPNPSVAPIVLSKTLGVKLGGVFAPVVLLSFVGGMLLWRALQPATNHPQLDKKLAELSRDNAHLQESLQRLADAVAARTETPMTAVQAEKAQVPKPPSGKLAMLKRVLDDNIRLRKA